MFDWRDRAEGITAVRKSEPWKGVTSRERGRFPFHENFECNYSCLLVLWSYSLQFQLPTVNQGQNIKWKIPETGTVQVLGFTLLWVVWWNVLSSHCGPPKLQITPVPSVFLLSFLAACYSAPAYFTRLTIPAYCCECIYYVFMFTGLAWYIRITELHPWPAQFYY